MLITGTAIVPVPLILSTKNVIVVVVTAVTLPSTQFAEFVDSLTLILDPFEYAPVYVVVNVFDPTEIATVVDEFGTWYPAPVGPVTKDLIPARLNVHEENVPEPLETST